MDNDLSPSQISDWESLMNDFIFEHWNDLGFTPVQVEQVSTVFVEQRRLNTDGRRRRLAEVAPLEILYQQTVEFGVVSSTGGLGDGNLEDQVFFLPFLTNSLEYTKRIGQLTSNQQLILVSSVGEQVVPTTSPTSGPSGTLLPTDSNSLQAQVPSSGGDGDNNTAFIVVIVIMSTILFAGGFYIYMMKRNAPKRRRILGEEDFAPHEMMGEEESGESSNSLAYTTGTNSIPISRGTSEVPDDSENNGDQGALGPYIREQPPQKSLLNVPQLLFRRNRSDPVYPYSHDQQEEDPTIPFEGNIPHVQSTPTPGRLAVNLATFANPVPTDDAMKEPSSDGESYLIQRTLSNSQHSYDRSYDQSYADASYDPSDPFERTGFEMHVQDLED